MEDPRKNGFQRSGTNKNKKHRSSNPSSRRMFSHLGFQGNASLLSAYKTSLDTVCAPVPESLADKEDMTILSCAYSILATEESSFFAFASRNALLYAFRTDSPSAPGESPNTWYGFSSPAAASDPDLGILPRMRLATKEPRDLAASGRFRRAIRNRSMTNALSFSCFRFLFVSAFLP